MLTEYQREQYRRHVVIDEVGEAGQARIAAGRVLVAGCGGLGSPAAMYLAAAGVGTIGLADRDTVELSNLHRQISHFAADLGAPKVESTRAKLVAMNPAVRAVVHPVRLDAANLPEIIAGYDAVVEATDNFPSKFLINDACVAAGKPFVHGGILRFAGEALTWTPGHGCYRCLFPAEPDEACVPSPARVGVFGPVPGIVGCIQATEALKLLLGAGELLTDRLLLVDALAMEFRTVAFARNPQCACAAAPVRR